MRDQPGLLFNVHEGADCIVRYVPATAKRGAIFVNEITYGAVLYAVRLKFKPGGFDAYCAKMRKLQDDAQ